MFVTLENGIVNIDEVIYITSNPENNEIRIMFKTSDMLVFNCENEVSFKEKLAKLISASKFAYDY